MNEETIAEIKERVAQHNEMKKQLDELSRTSSRLLRRIKKANREALEWELEWRKNHESNQQNSTKQDSSAEV